MHVDKKVGITLQVIGMLLLIATAIFKLPIFWPVFGMGCLLMGTLKVVNRIVKDTKKIQED